MSKQRARRWSFRATKCQRDGARRNLSCREQRGERACQVTDGGEVRGWNTPRSSHERVTKLNFRMSSHLRNSTRWAAKWSTRATQRKALQRVRRRPLRCRHRRPTLQLLQQAPALLQPDSASLARPRRRSRRSSQDRHRCAISTGVQSGSRVPSSRTVRCARV